MSPTWRVVLMGVSGSGKSTIGPVLAGRHGARFLEGDAFHPEANIAKMAAGRPLTDEDRWPWLAAIRQAMRGEERVVVACSALKRAYRDALRAAGDVRFVELVLDPDEARRRLAARPGHFMGPTMVRSQFEALERPAWHETDVVAVEERGAIASVVDEIEAALVGVRAGTAMAPLRSEGDGRRAISLEELRDIIDEVATTELLGAGVRRVLVVPPDLSRLRSRAGEITGFLYEVLTAAGVEVAVLPALGTHRPLTRGEAGLLFGTRVPYERILRHQWRGGVRRLGEIGVVEVSALSGGRVVDPVPVEVDDNLLSGWDAVVSVGQVVPHEVTGMANFSKNLVIGLGGSLTINRSHFLGALCGMEEIMGRANSPVRDVVDAAFDRFLAPRLAVLWVLTVVEDAPEGVVHRGLFIGRGRSGESGGAAYRAAAELAARCNIELFPDPLGRVVCWLDPTEFKTTWLANKAIYRTRMAMEDGGELVVLAPGVSAFGEDETIDGLIRRHGYRGTPATLEAVRRDPELGDNLGAAAHLIHGSSEGRFRIVYCTDPTSGGLTREEVEGVGYEWRLLPGELARLDIEAGSSSGRRTDRDGEAFQYIANPALGLWATSAAFP
ncbi:MAG: gluconokinase, GntK/IdnK-type [Acidimicrobiales bacterium]|jgi:carbohydrate kinase (thermoresistant glucokinase family)